MSGIQNYKDKISNHAQMGGIETSVLDNGLGRGNRIAWINTGTGLRYKVVIDRGMDIADAFYNQHSLAWLSHGGFSAPQPNSGRGIDWLKTFGGGLLTTCGLSHVGGPEKDEFGERGIHGNISNLPAEIVSIIQPDPVAGKMEMSITGIIKETKVFGPSLELRRTISGTLGEPTLKILDEVINRGNSPAPLMLMYHFNFGYPMIDEGTKMLWEGKWKPRFGNENAKIFKEGNDFKTCPSPLDDHLGTGEEVVLIDPNTDDSGMCMAGLYNAKIGLKVEINFKKDQLPHLINWQHWGKGEYVTGIEPATNPPIGQAQARANYELIFLESYETRLFEIELKVFEEQNL
jgi:galactose mutarotase-like enzyme